MRHTPFPVVALLTLNVALVATAQTVRPESGGSEPSGQLESLLKQRRETLQELVKVTTAQYRIGKSPIDSVIRAADQLLIAELELAEDRSARVAIHKQRIELLQSAEATAQTRFHASAATQEDVLAAKAALLEAKIQLLRVQLGK